MIKTAIKTLIPTFIVGAVIYILLSFIAWSFKIAYWSAPVRGLLLMSVIFLFYYFKGIANGRTMTPKQIKDYVENLKK